MDSKETKLNNNIRIAIDTLGCKVNQAESEQLSRQLVTAGFHIVPPEQPADIYVLNSCTVTHIADRKSRHRLSLAHRRNPAAVVVVTGCYAAWAKQDLAALPGVSLVVNNRDKSRLVQIIEESGLLSKFKNTIPAATQQGPGSIRRQKSRLTGQTTTSENSFPELLTGEPPWRTRAFIKVQDGCHNFCSYCIVPLVRSNEICEPPEAVVSEVSRREKEGYREVVITGVEVGSYRYADVDLTGLLRRVLADTGIPRLRLSSLQPEEITPDLLALWNSPRLCRHFHLSLQSGSNTVLRRMNRRYTTAGYARAAALIRSAVPAAAITTDIITGFPGETAEEFAASYEFCKTMEFARIHVFPFSPRKGTEAAALTDRVSDTEKRQRTEQMLALAETCIVNFSRKFLDQSLTVLFEQMEGGYWSGLTDNYIRVYVAGPDDLTNRMLPVTLKEIRSDGVMGMLLP